MRRTVALGPSWETLRPVKGVGKGFPVFEQLGTKLARLRKVTEPDEVARHVCAVLSGWCYSDVETLATMLSRLGLERCRVKCFDIANHGMVIRSTAYLAQSRDGRVGLLVYRGTDPFDFATWAVDLDINQPSEVSPGNIHLRPNAAFGAEAPAALVHAGFYRNQRATWFEIMSALKQAIKGGSIFKASDRALLPEAERPEASDKALGSVKPLEALYVTGHSLGAAMATIAAYKLAADESYEKICRTLKQVYLFAPLMVGNAAFKQLWDKAPVGKPWPGKLDDRVFCHTFGRDVASHAPPKGRTKYVHVGKHYASHAKAASAEKVAENYAWVPSSAPSQCSIYELLGAVRPVLFGHITERELLGPLAMPVTIAKAATSFLRTSLSFADHTPTNYILCSQPDSVNSEFGDDF